MFISTELVFLIVSSAALYLLVGLSFSLTYYPTRSFNLAHAAVITSGAYLALYFVKASSLPLLLAAPLAMAGGGALGVLGELAVFRHMRRRKSPPLLLLIASIGLYTVIQNLISLAFGDETQSLYEGGGGVGHYVLGAYLTTVQIVTVLASAALIAATLAFTKYTALGKSIRAVSTNPNLADVFGIDSERVILSALLAGSALGAGAGLLSALDTNMTPTMGFGLLLYGIIAMIIGGVGSNGGLVGGALLLASAQRLAGYHIDTKWTDAVAYAILIIFLIVRPLGLGGNRLKKVKV